MKLKTCCCEESFTEALVFCEVMRRVLCLRKECVEYETFIGAGCWIVFGWNPCVVEVNALRFVVAYIACLNARETSVFSTSALDCASTVEFPLTTLFYKLFHMSNREFEKRF